MNCLQTWTKQHFGQDNIGPLTEFDLDLNMTLTDKVKLLNKTKIKL